MEGFKALGKEQRSLKCWLTLLKKACYYFFSREEKKKKEKWVYLGSHMAVNSKFLY